MRRELRNARHRRAVVAVFTAFMLVVIFAMVACAIDVGYITHARTELQRTADTAALAAAQHLPNQSDALAAAQSSVMQNLGSVGPDTSGADVEFGYWNRDDATYTSPVSASQVNAVKVSIHRTAGHGNPLQLFFAPVIGSDESDVQASAIAIFDRNLCGPFIGIDWVSAPGSLATDSYDASVASYNSAFARDRGSLCSDGPIDIEGAAFINGNAMAGKGDAVTMYGSATVTGSIGSRRKPLNMPPVDASQAAMVNDNSQMPMIPQGNGFVSPIDANGNFALDGSKTLTVPPGTYYFNNVTLSGQAILNFSGDTTIYITGNFTRAGGVTVNNNTQIPNNLEILMTGGTANITSNNAFHGVIYAPNTDVIIDGSSDFFGAVVGQTLTVTGDAGGHYDESLDLDGVQLPKRITLVE